MQRRQISLAARPVGSPASTDFRADTVQLASPESGQLLLRTIWLSLDPYMRGRMNDVKSYAPVVALGEAMPGGTVSEVLESRHSDFSAGDLVVGYSGWVDHAVVNGDDMRRIEPGSQPLSRYLGVLGMPGHTAYCGLLDVGEARPGNTVVISAASGAVGQVVGQIAKHALGCYTIGIAGGEKKCSYVTDELGLDVCLDHREPDLPGRLAAALAANPSKDGEGGVDVNFESVGADVFDAVFQHMNVGGRIAICGGIGWYNLTDPPVIADRVPAMFRQILTRRLKVQGFIIFDHMARFGDFQRDVSGWLDDGTIKYREDVVDGLENAPDAFRGLLEGRNFGKLVVRVGADPA